MTSLPFGPDQVLVLRVINFQQTIAHVELELASGQLHKQNFLIVWLDRVLMDGSLSPDTILVWVPDRSVPGPWRHLLWTYPSDQEVLGDV